MEAKRLGVTHGSKAGATRFAGLGTWQVPHQMGHFPPAPRRLCGPTFSAAAGRQSEDLPLMD
jgi:hypothetical protein